MNTQNTNQTPEQMVHSARRFTAGLALLSNPDYTFTPFNTDEQAFYVEKTDGTIYLTSVRYFDCTCEDFKKNKKACKHVYAAQEAAKQNAQCEGYDENEESGRDEYSLL